MFWGCFSGGLGKGPSLFWEEDWGPIRAATHCEHTLPLLDGWQRTNTELLVMQDNAPGHAVAATQQEIEERHMRVIHWPASSPDLNPIETVWN